MGIFINKYQLLSKMQLDNKDKTLVYELGLNSRQSIRELAKKTKLSKSTVNYRIQRLIDNKIITGFKTYFNYSKIGIASFALYLKFQNTTKEIENKIINYFSSNESVTWLGSSYGNWELIIEFTVQDFLTLSNFLSEFYKTYNHYIYKKELAQYISQDMFSYKFLPDITEPKSLHIDFVGEKTELDEIDKKIITYIIKNPRYNLYKIAIHLSLSIDLVRQRIKKLVKNKIIAGYSIQLDFNALNMGWYILQLTMKDSTQEETFIEFIQKHPNTYYLIKYSGKWDYEIGLYIKDSKELENFISELKSNFSEQIKYYEFSLITNLHKFQ